MSLVYDGCMSLSHILIKTTKLITNNNYEKNYVFYLPKPPHLKRKKKHFPLDIPLTFSWCVGHVLLIQPFDWAQNWSKPIFYPLFQSNSQILNLVMTEDGCVSLDSGVVEYFRVFFLKKKFYSKLFFFNTILMCWILKYKMCCIVYCKVVC